MNTTQHSLKTVVIMATSTASLVVLYTILRGLEVPKTTSFLVIGSMVVLTMVVALIHWQAVLHAEDAATDASDEAESLALEAAEATGERAELLTKAAEDGRKIAEDLSKEALAAQKTQPIVSAITAGVGSVGFPLATVVHEMAILDSLCTKGAAIVALLIALAAALAATKVRNFWKDFAFNVLFVGAMGIGCYLIFRENLLGYIIVCMSALLAFAVAYWDALIQRKGSEVQLSVSNEIFDPEVHCGTKNQS